jgi:hypothetical protein
MSHSLGAGNTVGMHTIVRIIKMGINSNATITFNQTNTLRPFPHLLIQYLPTFPHLVIILIHPIGHRSHRVIARHMAPRRIM